MKQPIYAVVDIETTGTDPREDRIIQFGCVLIQNGQVINRFATDINPGRAISPQIQSLTHITNARVQKAPYFEDVAFTINNLLADTIFVAHNIYFDYKFLSAELKRSGGTALDIPGIDTVELAQIFLPCEESFRLGDLAESLGLEHENPHQADSDAEVTGALLLYIEAIMRALPIVTLRKIAELASLTGMQTGDFIKRHVAQLEKKNPPLAENLQIVEGLALQKLPEVAYLENHYQSQYPQKKKAKERIFGQRLEFRKEQARLMNLVYQHFAENTEKNLMIEAATGMGKSIGYLFPMNFLATPEKPLMVSTVSLVLQDQLIQKDVPLLNELFDQPIQATLLKGQRHYLDLQRFSDSLKIAPAQKQYALYQMGVLVWLTQTVTGDLDELNLVNLNHQFFHDVAHRGLQQLRSASPFYEVDFFRYLQRRIKASNVLIVNHALLAQESLREQPILPKSPYLVIDEAHHLAEICEKTSQLSFDAHWFWRELAQLTGEEGLFLQLDDLLTAEKESQHLLAIYQEELQLLVDCQAQFLNEFVPEKIREDRLVTGEEIQNLSLLEGQLIDRMLLYYDELLHLQQQMQKLLLKEVGRRLPKENQLVTNLYDFFGTMEKQAFVMKTWFSDWQPKYAHWLIPHEKNSGLTFRIVDFGAALLPQTKWYDRYEKVLFIGGTLKVGSDRSYFPKRLGIPETTLKVIPTPFDYGTQTKVILPDKGLTIQDLTPHEYAQYLAEVLTELLEKNQKPALILFTAHDILQRVYYEMHLKFLNQGREILAQGIGGSREKLLKRFRNGNAAILFGADSFWEGVDLPGDTLQIVVVTRLPFDNPKRPQIAARNDYLNALGINPFYEEAVPKAALKLRQAYGRLVRSKDDKGVLVILDRRVLTTKYGKRIRAAFPKKVIFDEMPTTDMRSAIDEFLKQNHD